MRHNSKALSKEQRSISSIDMRPVIIGRFGPPILACIRSWGRQGYPVGFICVVTDNGPKPVSKYLTDCILIQQKDLYTKSGSQIITNFLHKFQATGIIAIDEKISICLNDIAEDLTDNTKIWSSSNETMKTVLSKKNQVEIAKKAGFQVLPTYLIDKDFEDKKDFQSMEFPLCLRPSQPGSIHPTFKVKIAESINDLKEIMREITTINAPVICQPFKNLPNLVIHGARTVNGKTEGLKAFIVERKFEGVTLLIRPITVDSLLLKKCQLVTELFNIFGNYHFEFLYDPKTQQAFFLEINLRLGGTTAKVFCCGYDEPLFALHAFNPFIPIGNVKLQNREVSSKQALIKYLMYTLSGKITSLDYPSNESLFMRIKKTLHALMLCKDEVLELDDIKGSLSLYLQNLGTAVIR